MNMKNPLPEILQNRLAELKKLMPQLPEDLRMEPLEALKLEMEHGLRCATEERNKVEQEEFKAALIIVSKMEA
jgi:hypothetical protein